MHKVRQEYTIIEVIRAPYINITLIVARVFGNTNFILINFILYWSLYDYDFSIFRFICITIVIVHKTSFEILR
ncbi:hypothetical protein AXX13_E06 (plasmid) [Borrelia hermsii HS1]|uniref:Uncharacterized protein n=1 Tax=Borrelia hermsii HS1 TaxID=1867252 RepID=A0ABM6ARK2_BORHE|nr:hypothetical protein AXX13_E06 [Borrelia hermsii HS1]